MVKCFSSENVFGHVVPVKGADEEDYAAKLVIAAVLWLEHVDVIMKGDNEPALQALLGRSGIVQATMKLVKAVTEYPRKGNLYLADMALASFVGQGLGRQSSGPRPRADL